MELSNRLKEIAGMVTKGNVVCDVGTDHAYLAIYLIENEISPHVIAMDVAQGPLLKAERNISARGLCGAVETRLSDGVDKLLAGEAQTVVMAGMGGILICELLSKGEKVLASADELVLSPHTDVELVRGYLSRHGYRISQEKMLVEEGKYYIILRCLPGEPDVLSDCERRYGKYLLERKDPVLRRYLQKEYQKLQTLYENLEGVCTERAAKRRKELTEEIDCVKEGVQYYGM